MENYQPHLRKTVSYYQLLLQRYARRLVQDDNLAAKIVEEVLESQYNLNSLLPSKHLRQILKTDVLNKCYYHIQSLIFEKAEINEQLPNYLKTIIETDKAE
jgi:DNA-directed RNA polymerase specialized sigma24 family protein